MNHGISVKIAKTIMKLWPKYPDKNSFSMWEIFNLEEYKNAPYEKQNEIKLLSAKYRFDYEYENPFLEKYFPMIDTSEYRNKTILDLGCFTGGRLVAWKKKYQFREACGIDINPIFEDAASLFASRMKIDAKFSTGYGEDLPYEDDSFDFITSTDVFEHVRDVEKVMNECFRVLKPGGKLLAVFPQYYQPLEAHLGKVTRMPALQWLFSGKTLAKAAYEITKARGDQAYWYAFNSPELRKWERMHSLNGITVAKYRWIIKKNNWKVLYWSTKPILTDGRKAKRIYFRILSKIFLIPAKLPILEELFLGRICCVLEKRTSLR